jgi:hypothetical protein
MLKNNLTLTTVFITLLLVIGNILTSFTNDVNKNQTPRQSGTEILSSHAWITSAVVNQNNENINLDKAPGLNFVGYAYYKIDGTFRIVNLQDQPKIAGKWELIDNDTKRRLTIIRNDTTIIVEADVETLNNKLFTYKAIPDRNNPTSFYNVKHIPTDHKEPKTPAEALASVNWTTTKVLDITNGVENAIELDRTVAPAANFSGDSYYINNHGNQYFPTNTDGDYANGTFTITAYGDKESVRFRGDWYVSLDGKQRTLIAKNLDNTIAWRRTVSIFELTPTKFTYDVDNVGGRTLRVEHEPIK